MRAAVLFLFLPLGIAGCMSETQERVHTYNEDGLHLFQQGEYQQARDSFLAAAALTPDDAALYYNVGHCYERMGDAANAERYYNECLGRDLNNADCRHALAALMVRHGRRDEAVRMVQQWLAREPQRAAAYAEDGWLLFQTGDLPSAQARLQQALGLDPRDTRTLVELARVYEAMHRPDRAVALYERVLERNPRQFEVARRIKALKSQGADQPHPD
ncbi:MAG TPA: tetratricopeptide repeat protein [Gemmataceae bacterium]|jgi:tetratricopeptide (TPR) repeat protein|nr:tetratricopeptide repeat protein [Gemmataceae bacterium]